MQEAAASLLSDWQNFYVIVGSASASLTGLMFVVMTLLAGIRQRRALPTAGIAAFSTPSVVHFCLALLVTAILSMPWSALWPASLLLGLCGLGGVGYVAIVLRRLLRSMDYQPVMEDWLWHTVFPLISYLAIVVAAILLPVDPAPVLFVIAAATLLLVFIGIHNAWDNVTYLALEFMRPENKSQD